MSQKEYLDYELLRTEAENMKHLVHIAEPLLATNHCSLGISCLLLLLLAQQRLFQLSLELGFLGF